jgi:hypothetical protein
MLSNTQLRQIMRYHLDHFNSTGDEVTDDTVHDDILSTEGFGTANPARLYQGFVRFSLKSAGNPLKKWPNDWLKMSVADLADVLVPAVVAQALPRSRARRKTTRGKRARSARSGARRAPPWFKRLVLEGNQS